MSHISALTIHDLTHDRNLLPLGFSLADKLQRQSTHSQSASLQSPSVAHAGKTVCFLTSSANLFFQIRPGEVQLTSSLVQHMSVHVTAQLRP